MGLADPNVFCHFGNFAVKYLNFLAKYLMKMFRRIIFWSFWVDLYNKKKIEILVRKTVTLKSLKSPQLLISFSDFPHWPLVGKRILPWNVRNQYSNILDNSNFQKFELMLKSAFFCTFLHIFCTFFITWVLEIHDTPIK